MKRTLVAVALVVMVGILGSQVWAKEPSKSPGTASQVAPPEREKFFKETEPLRQALWEKQGQLRTLLSKQESDPMQVGTLEKEIFDLRERLRAKAQEAGFGCPNGAPGAGMRCGMGMGGGMGHGRHGMCLGM